MPEFLKGVYTPPDLASLVPLFHAPETLAGTAGQCHLDLSPAALGKRVKVETLAETNRLIVTLQWEDTSKGAEMVNELMSNFIIQAGIRRDETLRKITATMGKSLDDCNLRLIKKRNELAQLVAKKELDAEAAQKTLAGPLAERDKLQTQLHELGVLTHLPAPELKVTVPARAR